MARRWGVTRRPSVLNFSQAFSNEVTNLYRLQFYNNYYLVIILAYPLRSVKLGPSCLDRWRASRLEVEIYRLLAHRNR